MNAQPGARATLTEPYTPGDDYIYLTWITTKKGLEGTQSDGGYTPEEFTQVHTTWGEVLKNE